MAMTDTASNGAPENQAAGGQQRTEAPRGAAWSFHQSNLIQSPVAAGVGGEYFTKLRTRMTEIFTEIAPGVEVKVLGLNRERATELKFSALVIAMCIPSIGQEVIAYHTLILEATGDKLPPIVRTIDNMPVSIRRVTGDAFDDVLQKLAYEAAAASFPNANAYGASAMVVPADISIDAKEVIENIARNAGMACVNMINTVTNNYGELNLANMDREARLAIDVAFGQHQVKDVVGMPQRSSVLIQFSSSKKKPGSYAGYDVVNSPDEVTKVCELSGFVTPIWAPENATSGYGFTGYQDPKVPQSTQKFVPELVLTNIQTPYATALPAVLFGFTSCFSLVDGDNWLQAFLPRKGAYGRAEPGKVDITDIGALNITANVGMEPGGFGRPVDIASLGDDYIEINKYLVSIFRQGLAISLDCPEAGAQSWYMSVFSAAASGDPDAYNQIWHAAQELTNGNFERHFPHGTPMFSNVTRVPLGYYMSGGQLLDIRNIDYTAIANIFAGNPSIIHEYSNSFVERNGVSAIRNLASREGIISEACQHQLTITGYALRVTLAGQFTMGLSAAIADCKVPVQVNTPLSADQMRIGTPAPGFINQALARGTHTFNPSYQPLQQHQPYAWRHQGYGRRG